MNRDQEGTDEEKITEVYLRAFSRPPTPVELKTLGDHVADTPNKQQAWEDVLWAVLNAKEFQFVR